MKPAKSFCCQFCGVTIPPGGMFYTGRVEIVSGGDGIFPDLDNGCSPEDMIEESLAMLAKQSDQEITDEVHQEISVLLCGKCRVVFRDTVLKMIRW